MLRTLFSALLMLALGGPASAQQATALTDNIPNLIQWVITALGMVVAARLAFDAFGRRAVPVANVPTFPQYMTSRLQYRLGSVIFVLLACGFFLLLVYEHRDVVDLASSATGVIPDNILEAVKDQSASYLTIIAAMGAVYLYLLNKEADWNVLLTMRDLI